MVLLLATAFLAPPIAPADENGDERLAAARHALDDGRLDDAEALYRRLIADEPQRVAAYQGLAATLAARGETGEAVAILVETGRGLVRARRHDEAVAPLETAVALAPGRADLLRLLGRALAETSRFEEAVARLEHARELGDSELETLLVLAAAHWELRHGDVAEALYHEALEIHGDRVLTRFQLGQFLLWQGRAAEAVAQLERAAAGRGDHVEILFFLARARAEAGDVPAAVATWDRLLELDPDNVRARRLRDLLRRRPTDRPPPPSGVADVSRRVVFSAVGSAAGLDFHHDPGVSPARHLPETMGSGLAWIDYDGDGWWDLYLVQSGGENRLYRNRGGGAFEDVTRRSGAGESSYGQGAVAADLDGDGDVDLYLANHGPDAVLENRGDGTFTEAAERLGLATAGWSSSAALADADGDGDLDLYVVRYVDYDSSTAPACGEEEREYCNVLLFAGLGDRFYRQRDDGTFEDATAAAGLDAAADRGLGVVWTDLDGDGLSDLYVANDLDANRLYRNRGDGTFDDVTLLSGAALNGEGVAEAGMGVAAGDVDGDARPELLVTHFDNETNTLYRNLGDLLFDDVSAASGFGLASANLLGFGLELADFNRDGTLDVYVANGHVFLEPERDERAQRDLLLLGDGHGGFREQELDAFAVRVGRGAAAADYDNDGDADLAVTSNGGPVELLRNDTDAPGWLGVELVGGRRNTGAIGARVALVTRRGRQVRWVMAGRGYQSSADRRLLFAWPPDEEARELEVVWPSGHVTRIVAPPVRRYLRLVDPRQEVSGS